MELGTAARLPDTMLQGFLEPRKKLFEAVAAAGKFTPDTVRRDRVLRVEELPVVAGELRGAGKTEGSKEAARLPFPRVCDVGLATQPGIGLQTEDEMGDEASEGGEEGGVDPLEEDLLAAAAGAGDSGDSGSDSGAAGASGSESGGSGSESGGSGAAGAGTSGRPTVAEALKAARGARPLDGCWGAAWVLQVRPGADHITLPPRKLAGQTRTYEKIFDLARHTPSGVFVERAAGGGTYAYSYLSLQQIATNGLTAAQPLSTMLPLELAATPAASQDISMDISSGEEQAGINSEDETLENRWVRLFCC